MFQCINWKLFSPTSYFSLLLRNAAYVRRKKRVPAILGEAKCLFSSLISLSPQCCYFIFIKLGYWNIANNIIWEKSQIPWSQWYFAISLGRPEVLSQAMFCRQRAKSLPAAGTSGAPATLASLTGQRKPTDDKLPCTSVIIFYTHEEKKFRHVIFCYLDF